MSTDGGTVWTQMDSYYSDGGCCIVHPDSANLVITGGIGPSASFVVSWSRNSGSTWTRRDLSQGVPGYCYALAIAPSQSNVIYAGGIVSGAGKVYKSTDRGVNWGACASPVGETVFGLAIHPDDADYVYAATTSGLFRTTNGGSDWSNIEPVRGLRSVALHPAGPDTVVVAGAPGVYISRDAGSNWQEMNSGLGGLPAACVEFANHVGTCLIAGTVGGSCYAWQFETGIGAEPRGPAGSANRFLPGVFAGYCRAAGHEGKMFVVLDYSGRKVAECRGDRVGENLAAGVYFVRSTQPGVDVARVVKTR